MAASAWNGADTLSVPHARPGSGKKWSEVRQGVQQPDGSVRTPALLKGGGGAATAASPPCLLRPVSLGLLRRPSGSSSLGVTLATVGRASSRGGTSRGCSSGKSSRSSSHDVARDGQSRDGHSRDGDISSRCSSGACWETSTNASEPSRPRTPPDAAQSSCTSKGLLMPNPIRSTTILLPALLDDEPAADAGRAEGSAAAACATELPIASADDALVAIHARPGILLASDPLGRDGSRRLAAKGAWSVEPLAKYLKGVAVQIDSNLRNEKLPTTEKLDTYVSKLVLISRRKMHHAPKKVRHTLQSLFSHRFQKFWNFNRNEKVRSTTPEELKQVVIPLIEQLISEFAGNLDMFTQAKLAHCTDEQFQAH